MLCAVHVRPSASCVSPLPPCSRAHAAHKEASGCSGKRDRTAFVGRANFDERTFFSDYRFLEEVKLVDDVAKRSKPPAPKLELPQFLQTLQYQAGRWAPSFRCACLRAPPPRPSNGYRSKAQHAPDQLPYSTGVAAASGTYVWEAGMHPQLHAALQLSLWPSGRRLPEQPSCVARHAFLQARRAAAHPVSRHGEAAHQHHPLRRPHAHAAVARGVALPCS